MTDERHNASIRMQALHPQYAEAAAHWAARLDLASGQSRWFVIDGGFAQMQGDALTLLVDGAEDAGAIDAGRVSFAASGWLGGWTDQGDNAQVYISFLDAAGNTLATSAIYELIEWGAAEFFGGELGAAYLGTQGDIWDAHKDMALAGCGALLAMLITAAINRYLQRDFAREWSNSLKVKDSRPYGENEIKRMLDEREGA